jgi:hypothetical protein
MESKNFSYTNDNAELIVLGKIIQETEDAYTIAITGHFGDIEIPKKELEAKKNFRIYDNYKL